MEGNQNGEDMEIADILFCVAMDFVELLSKIVLVLAVLATMRQLDRH